MKPLPRPVKSLLAEPPVDASVMRIWAKVQIKRRVPAPLARPWLVFAGAAALVAFAVMVSPRAPAPPAQLLTVGVAPVTQVAAFCRPSAPSTVLLHARRPSAPVTRPAGSSPAVTPEATDVVGTLFASVEDAAREGHTDQVIAVLGEIAEHHTDDPRAAEALFMLGSLQLDSLKRPGLAAASFRRALELRPSEDLVPQLWERLQEAEAR